jgi:hypothetical protein
MLQRRNKNIHPSNASALPPNQLYTDKQKGDKHGQEMGAESTCLISKLQIWV